MEIGAARTSTSVASQIDRMGAAMIFKLGAMPYDIVERSMTLFGEAVMPRIRRVLDEMLLPSARSPHRRCTA
jgi:hypothetical protein